MARESVPVLKLDPADPEEIIEFLRQEGNIDVPDGRHLFKMIREQPNAGEWICQAFIAVWRENREIRGKPIPPVQPKVEAPITNPDPEPESDEETND